VPSQVQRRLEDVMVDDVTRDVYEMMSTQRAIRRFKPEPVPDEVIARLIEAATWAPSGSNRQPWAFVVVRDDAKREAIAAAIRERFRSGSGERPDPATIEDPTRRRMLSGAFALMDDFAAAPVLIVPCLVSGEGPAPQGLLAGSSIYPSVQNLLLAARAEGLGTVMTTPQGSVVEALRQVLDLPPQATPVATIPLGYPDAQFGPVTRRPAAEFAHWDGWGGSRAISG
jgi:nitroreductase